MYQANCYVVIDEEKVVDLFENIANKNISMDMISQTAPMNSKITVSFTIPKEDLVKAKEIVSKYVSSLETVCFSV